MAELQAASEVKTAVDVCAQDLGPPKYMEVCSHAIIVVKGI